MKMRKWPGPSDLFKLCFVATHHCLKKVQQIPDIPIHISGASTLFHAGSEPSLSDSLSQNVGSYLGIILVEQCRPQMTALSEIGSSLATNLAVFRMILQSCAKVLQ